MQQALEKFGSRASAQALAVFVADIAPSDSVTEARTEVGALRPELATGVSTPDLARTVVIDPPQPASKRSTGRAALSPEHAALYGHMYDGFAKLVGANWDTMLDPSVVAATVVDALQTATPQARYQVGEDSKFLCETSKKTDAEIDAVMAAFAS